MRPDQFELSGYRPKRCGSCRAVIDGAYYRTALWVQGDPEWAHTILCPTCHDQALDHETTAAGAGILARRDAEIFQIQSQTHANDTNTGARHALGIVGPLHDCELPEAWIIREEG